MSIANASLWLSLLIVQTVILIDGLGIAPNFGFFAVLTIFGTIRYAVQMKRTEGLSPAECKVLYTPVLYKNIAYSKQDALQTESMLEEDEIQARVSLNRV